MTNGIAETRAASIAARYAPIKAECRARIANGQKVLNDLRTHAALIEASIASLNQSYEQVVCAECREIDAALRQSPLTLVPGAGESE